MKKLLLISTAIAGVAFMSAPASAAVKLDLGGFFRGYGVWADSNEVGTAGANDDLREFDLRRDTEVFVTGETTLDNGLTVGFHTEQDLGGATMTDEAYAYFSSGMGRINLGSEDGVAYLLQVNAPSADSNVDGLRTVIQGINASPPGNGSNSTVFTAGIPGLRRNTIIDYDHISDSVNNADRISYMTPKFNGFQAGVSYAPESGQNAVANNIAGMNFDDNIGDYEDIWEIAARWDGEFQGVGLALGGGYSHASQEVNATLTVGGAAEDTAPVVSDGLSTWNAGANVSFSGFSLGGAFMRSTTENFDVREVTDASTVFAGKTLDVEMDTWVVGLGYDNGPYHVGASYLRQSQERDASGVAADGGEVGAVDADATRFTVGAGYTFGPGMTFRGAVAWGEFDNAAIASDAGTSDGVGAAAGPTTATSQDFTQFTVGTDIQF